MYFPIHSNLSYDKLAGLVSFNEYDEAFLGNSIAKHKYMD